MHARKPPASLRSLTRLPWTVLVGLALVAPSSHALGPKPALPKPTMPIPPVNPTPKPKAPAAPASPLFKANLNDGKQTLRGFVDLHAHPMSHLGFGGHVVHGAPGVDVLMPVGQIYKANDCNRTPVRAKSKDQALGSCYSAHAGHDFIKNKCGNHIRRLVLSGLEDGNHSNKPHDVEHPAGAPAFTRWPKHDDILHQQMWVDWIERAHKGGMRVMVALAVNNYTLAHGLEASPANPRRDKASGDLQIAELKRFVAKHSSFMEIAYSAQDVRRIVGEKDKLAVIIGVELDDMGDFVIDKQKPSAGAVRQEIRRLHGLGVRYAFPVHLIDNVFAGTAAYEDELNRANCFHKGNWWNLRCADGKGRDEQGINHKVGAGADAFKLMKLGSCGGKAPVPTCTGADKGHVNKAGLTPLGRQALAEMMRLGMLIDIDHASLASLHGILDETAKPPAGEYPLVSGHNVLRTANDGNENQRTKAQYLEIAERKGIAGVGWGDLRSDQWLANLKAVKATGVPIAIGSDINGLVIQPSPRSNCSAANPCVNYSASFPKPTFGSKTWDYNKDGVAHVGLFPDVLRDLEGQSGGTQVVDSLFDGAEAFAVMWERAEKVGKTVAAPNTAGKIAITKARYGENCGIAAGKGTITSWVAKQCHEEGTCDYEFTWAPWGGDPNPSLCTKQIVIDYRCGTKAKKVEVLHTKTPQKVRLSCP